MCGVPKEKKHKGKLKQYRKVYKYLMVHKKRRGSG